MNDAEQPSHDSSCRRVVAAGAFYDLFAVGPLATPPTAPYQLEVLNFINQSLGLTGEMPLFLPVHMLFINLFGTLVLIWIGLRLFWYRQGYVLIDLTSRLCISVLLGWYAFQGTVNGIIFLFLFVEIAFIVANVYAQFSAKSSATRKAIA